MLRNLVFYKEEKRLISSILLLVMIVQMFLSVIPINVYADSKGSVEIVLNNDGEPISNGVVKIMEQGVEQMSFIKENGVYKANPSGYYKDITAGSQGDVILTGLDVGIYTVLYIKNDKTEGAINFTIENKADFKQVDFNVGRSSSNVEDGESVNEGNVVEETSSDMKLKFNSSGVQYRIEDEQGNRLSFLKTNRGYILGGSLDYIESDSEVRISSVEHGTYHIIGQGKRYTVKIDSGNNKFYISDNSVEEEIIEEVLKTGSLNLSIKDKKTSKRYAGVYLEIIDNNGNIVNFDKVGSNEYKYNENGNLSELEYDKKDIRVLGLPEGDYTIIDTSSDDVEFEDVDLEIKNNKTAIVDIRKGQVEHDLQLKLELEDEEDKLMSEKDVFVFNIEDEDGNVLKFKNIDNNYVYDEDEGEKDIELGIDEIDIIEIPFDNIELVLISAPKGFDSDVENILIELSEDNTYKFKPVMMKYSLTVKDIDQNPIEGVVASIIDEDGIQVSKAVSDEDGELEFDGIDEEEKYKLEIKSVPSPYSLPNQGDAIDFTIKEKEIRVKSVVNDPIVMGSLEDLDTSVSSDSDIDKDLEKDNVDEDVEDKETALLEIPYASFTARTSSGKKGSIFSFVDKDGEEVYRLTTEEDGEIFLEKIEHGEYVITQLTVADGYKISEEKYKLIVDGNYVSEIYTFENPKIGGEQEIVEDNKGKDRTIAVVSIILVLFLAAINLYISNQRYKDEHGENKYKIFDKLDSLLNGDEDFETLTEEELSEYEYDEDIELEEDLEGLEDDLEREEEKDI